MLRSLAFGDPAGGTWGAVVQLGQDVALASCAGAAHVRLSAEGGLWRVDGEGISLAVEPAPAPVPAPAPAEPAPDSPQGPRAPHERCRVTGRLPGPGGSDVDLPGVRISLADDEAGPVGSARAFYAWFPDDRALALLALRPPRARDHEADRTAATMFEPEQVVAVSEPRLSTTYGSDGNPRRASLELWVQEGEEEYPRRAAGEARDRALQDVLGGLRLTAVPMLCHGRGEDGAGVYLLVSS